MEVFPHREQDLCCNGPVKCLAVLQVLKMLGLPDEFMRLLVTKPYLGRIHVQPLFGLQPEKLQEHIKSGPWTHVCAFRPTGDTQCGAQQMVL